MEVGVAMAAKMCRHAAMGRRVCMIHDTRSPYRNYVSNIGTVLIGGEDSYLT